MLWLPHGTVDHRPAVGDLEAVFDARLARVAGSRDALERVRDLEARGEPVPHDLRVASAIAQRAGKGGLVSLKRDKARLRHLWNWSIGRGHADATPFKRGTATVIALDTTNGVEDARTRRLEPGISALAAEGWRHPQASPVL
jgi:hypothetical protein